MAKGVLKLKKYLILAVVTLLAVALSACSGNVKINDTSVLDHSGGDRTKPVSRQTPEGRRS